MERVVKMKKSEYLDDPDVSAFLDYFKEIVFGGEDSFCQSYKPKRKKKTGKLFSISSFKQAYDEYWWDESDFTETHNKLKGYSGQIERHLKSTDYTPTLITSLRILDWGGVVNQHSVRWLVDSHEDSTICLKIERAIEILSSKDDSETLEFKGNVLLRSDSATTKLFSLGSKKSIIYDDRVGGALARITREYLESSGAENVPKFLNFMRGSANGKARNPSTDKYRFCGKKTGHLHALSNIRANWLIQEIVKDKRFAKHFCCPGKAENHKMRILEAALFMIGYDLTTIDKIVAPDKNQPKKTVARRLFLKLQTEGATPQQIKQSFIDDVSLTKNGANTYYYNFKNQTW
jgi:hypothetical protein